jgi:protein-disulfide isomerase
MSKLSIPVSTDDHAQGEVGAKCTLVEYGDYQCPYCGQAHPIVKRLQKHFGADLRLVFRNFPLSEIHANALQAAETAEFAGAHGKFWEMHDLLFEHQRDLSIDPLFGLAQRLALAPGDLRDALEQGTYEPRIEKDFLGGVRSGVNGTPTFFINGQRHDDSFEYETLREAIGRHLAPSE